MQTSATLPSPAATASAKAKNKFSERPKICVSIIRSNSRSITLTLFHSASSASNSRLVAITASRNLRRTIAATAEPNAGIGPKRTLSLHLGLQGPRRCVLPAARWVSWKFKCCMTSRKSALACRRSRSLLCCLKMQLTNCTQKHLENERTLHLDQHLFQSLSSWISRTKPPTPSDGSDSRPLKIFMWSSPFCLNRRDYRS